MSPCPGWDAVNSVRIDFSEGTWKKRWFSLFLNLNARRYVQTGMGNTL